MPLTARGELIPDFRLPSSRGGRVSPWDFKQLRHLVVLFHHGLGCQECRGLLSEVGRRYPELAELRAELLALSPDPPAELVTAAEAEALPFPLLSDRGGAVLDAYLPEGRARLPAAVVADRYGALGMVVPGEGHRLDLAAVIEELAYFQTRCPECSVEDV